jgi:hypothetical protein
LGKKCLKSDKLPDKKKKPAAAKKGASKKGAGKKGKKGVKKQLRINEEQNTDEFGL